MTSTTHSQGTTARLQGLLEGELIRPGEDGYEEHRHVWNGMIDKRPALIARCASVSDVVRTVNFACEEGLLLAVRGGGPRFAGFPPCREGWGWGSSFAKTPAADPYSVQAPADGSGAAGG